MSEDAKNNAALVMTLLYASLAIGWLLAKVFG
jgi:hypothetical protein